MPAEPPTRLLSIGEFAAATQLSPKALRLYDEQRLLLPASVDAISGYRYYRREQIATGRLVRTLRDLGLSLAQIAEIVAVSGVEVEQLLVQHAQEVDRRYARHKRAFQSALASLRNATSVAGPQILEHQRPAMTTCVWPFVADQVRFAERFHAAVAASGEVLSAAGATAAGEPRCSLVDPLSEDEGRLEVLIQIVTTTDIPRGLTLRHSPPSPCAAVVSQARTSHASDLTATLDAMFDWFDRRGHRASEPPSLAIGTGAAGLRTDILWAYEAGDPSR